MGEKEIGMTDPAYAREAGSGMATGRGMHPAGQASQAAMPGGMRAASSGHATEKMTGEDDWNPPVREAGSGQASGIAIGEPGVNESWTVDTSPPTAGLAIGDPGVNGNFAGEPPVAGATDEAARGMKPADPKSK